MFDHRQPPAPTPFPWLRATLGVLALAGAVAVGRHWLQARNQPPIPEHRNAAVAAAAPSDPAVRRDAPVAQLAILVFKSEKRLEVWGRRSGKWTLLRDYPILAASGAAGPKLADGDRQVPEGIYRIAELNPHSRFHLSMKLDFPNAFDKKMAEADGRFKLGKDICIHGKNCSVGCVAIGDPAIEDLYALVENVRPANVKIILAPNDLRGHIPVRNPNLKIAWLGDLYADIARELKPFARN